MTIHEGELALSGDVGLEVIRGDGAIARPNPTTGALSHPLSLGEITFWGAPQKHLPDEVNEWRKANWPRLSRQALRQKSAVWIAGKIGGVATLHAQLFLTVFRADGDRLPYGLASVKLVTDAGVDFIVDAFQNTTEIELFNFHGIGLGSTAEAATETALVTELTTQYNPDNTRATGTQGEGASTNIYQTVGTNTVDATVLLREHGILTQAATGGGTLLDRSLFALITLDSGDSLQSTYELTVASGG